MSQKVRQEKNWNYIKMTLYSQRFLNYAKMKRYSQRFQMAKCSNTLKLYKLEALLSKKRLYLFFFYLLMYKNSTIF